MDGRDVSVRSLNISPLALSSVNQSKALFAIKGYHVVISNNISVKRMADEWRAI
jgi:hypothetical protein